MLVASVLSLKGGVGKTTVTLGLASAAVARGIDTVLVDLDPQLNATATVAADWVAGQSDRAADGSATEGRNGKKGKAARDKKASPAALTVADVLDADGDKAIAKAVNRAVRAAEWEPLRLLPGSEAAEAHNHPDPSSKRLRRLATALAAIDPAPALVLIDCPPSLGQLTRSALVASQRAVLVTEPSLFAVTGVQRALEAVQTERATHHPALQPLGVVINRFRPRVSEHEFRLAELRDLFGPLVLSPVLPDRSAVQQAQGAAVPIHQWPTNGAREIAQSFDALLDRLLRANRARPRPAALAGA
ncbi:ParA family protein [Nakamurella flava]|uniref:ParA family protein n=1 Tax=Nakamurella flava TaxID=2576308 RepID=A0A4U6Q7X3_9ACTN|nr:ParA family protein [Nakamurella flava]TKV56101.1 ParA family protein [Nakamurella flava]